MFSSRVTCRMAKTFAGRPFATIAPTSAATRNHKIVLVGGGTAGLSISQQLLRSGNFKQDDIAIIDPAEFHHYQPGWTLVGGGLKRKEDLRQPLASLINPKLKFYNNQVSTFSPEENFITLENGDKINYEQLVVVPGIHVDTASIRGLPEALAEPSSLVSTVYSYDTCDKANMTIQALKKGTAIFTQPAGVIKCAGAPQKVMWLAWDRWTRAGLYDAYNPSKSAINISFYTGLPSMFGVPKYSAALEVLRKQRGIEGFFQHDLISIDGNIATFALPSGGKLTQRFDLLHVVPKMGPHAFVKNSSLVDAAGYVDVDKTTLRHNKFANIWSAGDASSAPTSKTAAAITAQGPVIVSNLLRTLECKELEGAYDGYTSCPLTTGENKVLLAEFKYGGIPKETFGQMFGIDQAIPRNVFYHLKKSFFPWVYYNSMVKGTWGGPKGWIK